MACAVTHVSNWSQLLHATQDLQQFAQRVHVVLDNNITVPINYNRIDNGTMLVYRDVKVRRGCMSTHLHAVWPQTGAMPCILGHTVPVTAPCVMVPAGCGWEAAKSGIDGVAAGLCPWGGVVDHL